MEGGFTDTSDAGIDVSAKDDGTSGTELCKGDLRDFFFFGLIMLWSPSAAIGIDDGLSPGTKSGTCIGRAVTGGFTDTSDAGADVSARDGGANWSELCKSDFRDFFFFGLITFWSPSAAIMFDEELRSGTRPGTWFGKSDVDKRTDGSDDESNDLTETGGEIIL